MTALVLSREQAREVDRRAIEEFRVPAVVLMENAGRGAADVLLALGARGPVVVCCGKGNNGGDGFVIARHLDNRGVPVRVLLIGGPAQLTDEAEVNYRIVRNMQLPIRIFSVGAVDPAALAEEFAGAEWIVDALFGTGLRGAVRAPFDEVIAGINASGVGVLAVDIPSGLDCDTGQPLGPTVRARHTATFVALKKGYTNPAAGEWLGQVHVIDVGCPRAAVVGTA